MYISDPRVKGVDSLFFHHTLKVSSDPIFSQQHIA
jgi:hypothetical protein